MKSSICVTQIICAAHHQSLSLSFPRRRRNLLSHPTRTTATRPRRSRLPLYSKRSDFQEFRDYKKPLRLFPATDLNICAETSEENIVTSLSLEKSHSLFKVKLQTSGLYDSSLSNLTSGIQLMLIDENGDSIIQRIPSNLKQNFSTESESMVGPDKFSFQRGSVDEFTFKGPKLGRIEAIWIGLESGRWRLGGVNLTVISACQHSLENGDEGDQYVSCEYNFEAEDILLGERSDTPMMELRPCFTTESVEAEPYALLRKSPTLSTTSPLDIKKSNEESMKEYADLKFSLLFYDAVLISIGTTLISFSAGENVGFAFLTGGVGGFLYLWLLQKSVDGLPGPEMRSGERGGVLDELLSGIRNPISTLALAVGLAGLVAKFGFGGDVSLALTPKEVVVGMMGFLACKVAVVLASVKPLQTGMKANK